VQPTISERLEHIATAINNIRKITAGQTRESFELRHAYHEIDAGLLWAMIENDLDPLDRFIEQIVKELNR
jgi:uncharacterized protein with HEPN domain